MHAKLRVLTGLFLQLTGSLMGESLKSTTLTLADINNSAVSSHCQPSDTSTFHHSWNLGKFRSFPNRHVLDHTTQPLVSYSVTFTHQDILALISRGAQSTRPVPRYSIKELRLSSMPPAMLTGSSV